MKHKKEMVPQRALVTGISGFVGKHLAGFLKLQGWQIYGFDHRKPTDAWNVFIGDLTDREVFKTVLKECRPDVVFHLAGLIKSAQPEMLYQSNLLGAVAMLDSLVETGQRPSVIVASSGAVYGSGLGSRPISEKLKPHPATHYAVSKLAQEIAALSYFDTFQLPVVILRMFNLLGPGQSLDLACSAFARQIALAEAHGENEITTGDLSTRRDFVDVRDAVRAFVLVAEKDKAGQVYNVCSGRSVLMRKCLEDMLSMSPQQFKVRMDPIRVQNNDVPSQVGSARKLNRATGWRPQISLRQSLSDLLEYWRQRVKSGME